MTAFAPHPDRIVVTGATGFVGHSVIEQLVADGHRLVLAVRDAARVPPEWHGRADIDIREIKDFTSASELENAMQGAGKVVHLAGLAHTAAPDTPATEARFMAANAHVTASLAAAAMACGVSAFVHLSSMAVMPNELDQIIDDNTADNPGTPYGRSKLAAEEAVSRLANTGVFAVSLRCPLVVGAKAKGNWAALQALAATPAPLPFASVQNRRGLISAQTLSEAIRLLCARDWPASLSGKYCLTDPELLSLGEIVLLLRQGMGRPKRLLPFPVALLRLIGVVTGRRRLFASLVGNLKVDPGRFFRTFEFHPRLPIRDAIRQSGAAYADTRRNDGAS